MKAECGATHAAAHGPYLRAFRSSSYKELRSGATGQAAPVQEVKAHAWTDGGAVASMCVAQCTALTPRRKEKKNYAGSEPPPTSIEEKEAHWFYDLMTPHHEVQTERSTAGRERGRV
eukprot:1150300-Pelagomonas_calceolata.AAC.3